MSDQTCIFYFTNKIKIESDYLNESKSFYIFSLLFSIDPNIQLEKLECSILCFWKFARSIEIH